MTVDELVEELQTLQQEGKGQLSIRMYADHGQCSMKVHNVGIMHIEEETYMAEVIDVDDVDDYPDAIAVVEIS